MPQQTIRSTNTHVITEPTILLLHLHPPQLLQIRDIGTTTIKVEAAEALTQTIATTIRSEATITKTETKTATIAITLPTPAEAVVPHLVAQSASTVVDHTMYAPAKL